MESLTNRENVLDPKKDFIEQVTNFIHSTTQTSKRWAECIAISMLSTIMGPNRYISNIKGKLTLNTWFLCIGPSGLASKTIPMKTYLTPTMTNISNFAQDNYHFVLPSRFSVEGFIKYFDTRNVGIIIRDEFTSMIKDTAKDYISDVLEFLSEMYDGQIQPRFTAQHGLNELKTCYIVFIGATTPYLYRVMKPDFFTQGTGNRMMIELFDDSDIREIKQDPETFFRGPAFEMERDSFINDVSETLERIRRCNMCNLYTDEEASKLWVDFEFECRSIALRYYRSNMYDLHYSYLSRSAEMALKLCALYAVSRRWSKIIRDDAPTELLVQKQDMERAIKRAKHHFQQFCKMLEQWRMRPEINVAKTLDEQAFFVTDILQRQQTGITWTELRRLVKWDTYTWREVIKFLFETDKVVIAQGESSSRGGRRPVYFFAPGVLINGKALTNWRLIESTLNF